MPGPGALTWSLTIVHSPDRARISQRFDLGARLRIGQAELEITGDRPACREMLEIHADALKAMVGRAGKMARVVRGGTVRPGDPIELIGGADAISDGVSGQRAT